MDWIGVYAAGRCGGSTGTTCPSGSNWWARINTASPNSVTAGTLSMTIPASALTTPPTTYYGYFLINDLYNIATISNGFSVQSSCTTGTPTIPVLTASATTVTAGGFFKISWSNVSTTDLDDRLMFTASGAPSSTNFLSDCWQYTYGDQALLGQHPAATGSVSIKAPATPGTYNVYYCFNNGFNCPSSLSITVTAPTVTCRAAGNTASNIKHIITIISENHSFDSYFGKYCTAAFGSNPTCNNGRACCEAYKPVSGLSPVLLNDAQNIAFDPCHSQACELCEMNGGLMDSFTVTGAGKSCSNAGANNKNFAVADGSVGSANQYWGWAQNYAMSDRFFQSAPGASSQGEMYFARGAYVFTDNSFAPATSTGRGSTCSGSNCIFYNDPTIGDLLQTCQVPFKFYHVGWPTSDDPTDDAF
ncbi:UNVERIFIED_CONTAM: hypothetical protein HDU68_012087, partial [Siphonaria sp. JEL0065]